LRSAARLDIEKSHRTLQHCLFFRKTTPPGLLSRPLPHPSPPQILDRNQIHPGADAGGKAAFQILLPLVIADVQMRHATKLFCPETPFSLHLWLQRVGIELFQLIVCNQATKIKLSSSAEAEGEDSRIMKTKQSLCMISSLDGPFREKAFR
jgi:hypothetical protein